MNEIKNISEIPSEEDEISENYVYDVDLDEWIPKEYIDDEFIATDYQQIYQTLAPAIKETIIKEKKDRKTSEKKVKSVEASPWFMKAIANLSQEELADLHRVGLGQWQDSFEKQYNLTKEQYEDLGFLSSRVFLWRERAGLENPTQYIIDDNFDIDALTKYYEEKYAKRDDSEKRDEIVDNGDYMEWTRNYRPPGDVRLPYNDD